MNNNLKDKIEYLKLIKKDFCKPLTYEQYQQAFNNRVSIGSTINDTFKLIKRKIKEKKVANKKTLL